MWALRFIAPALFLSPKGKQAALRSCCQAFSHDGPPSNCEQKQILNPLSCFSPYLVTVTRTVINCSLPILTSTPRVSPLPASAACLRTATSTRHQQQTLRKGEGKFMLAYNLSVQKVNKLHQSSIQAKEKEFNSVRATQ